MDKFYKDVYNKLYKTGYHRGGFAGKELLKFLEENYTLSASDLVLDIGCSNGSGMKLINKLATADISYGFDPADLAIKYCYEKFTNDEERYKVGALPDIPFEDNFFNIIFCTDVLEHVLPDHINESFKEINRVTKDNAHIFLDIALLPETNRHDKITKEYEIENLHTTLFSSEEWFDVFEDNNLKVHNHFIHYEPAKTIRHKIDYSGKEGNLRVYLKKI